MLVPDIAYISTERLEPLIGEDSEYPPFAPDIAVEIRSPGESGQLRADKIARYLVTGALVVLDVDPLHRAVTAHCNGEVRAYDEHAHFNHPLIPWHTFNVATVLDDK